MKLLASHMPYNVELKTFSRELRKNQTKAEEKMWSAIRKRSVEGCLFLRQKPLLSYIADFYCASLLLVIEIDGSSHDHKKEADIQRTLALEEQGITVIRYTNDQVLYSLPRVIRHLTKTIQALKNKS